MKKITRQQWIVIGLLAGFLIGKQFDAPEIGLILGLVLGMVIDRKSPQSHST